MKTNIIQRYIEYKDSNGSIKNGFVIDKIKVLPDGANANYTSYVVMDTKTDKSDVVNPFNITRFTEPPKQNNPI